MNVVRFLLLTIFALGFAALGCSKPEPPQIVPKAARVVSVGPTGMNVVVQIEATNPNTITLSAQRMTGKAKLDGRWDMGAVVVDKPVVLPPGVPTMIEVPLTMPWSDLNALAALAASPRPVPYVVDGTVTIGGERLNIDLPYALTGTITREQIMGAALRGLTPP